ncbi:hypothetical protein Tco_1426606, partial [Tanacetum coccineum]
NGREASYGRASKDLNWLIIDKPELLISSLSTLAFVLLRPLGIPLGYLHLCFAPLQIAPAVLTVVSTAAFPFELKIA